jgi:large subunit ribosomal protein L9
MKVILLEKIPSLGNLGDEILVKPGFARNYLFPKYKAVLANKKNRDFFQNKIKEIEKNNEIDIEKLKEKQEIINNLELEIKVKASESGKLFGSITNKHISQLFDKYNVSVMKNEIEASEIINTVGIHNITINLKNNIKIDKKLSVIKED